MLNMKNLWFLITLLVSCILLTGCNKLPENSEIISDETQTNSFWIFHDIEEWTITLDNWEESITIMDRNLWAEVAWTWEESFWYYFQRWNNHWFQLNSEIKTWKDLVTRDVALQYWPNNWYDSDVQFVVMDNSEEVNRNLNLGNYFLAAVNDNLRWWSWDSEIVNRMWEYVIDQFRWDTGNPRTERQWPCPEWFHVPSFGEIHKLFKLWIDIKYPDDIAKKEHVRWMSIWGGGNQIWREFSNDLLLPMAWWIRFDGNATPHDQESEWFYWMSSPGRFLNFHSYMIVEYAESYRAATFPVRCFKNDEENILVVEEENMNTDYVINLKIWDKTFDLPLEKNSATKALIEKLHEWDVVVNTHEYWWFEKVGNLWFDLPRADKQITTEPGDLVLYQWNQISLFYESNSWSYTKLWKVQMTSKNELKEILWDWDVTLVFSLLK